MRVTLVYPPCADPALPHGALPLLGAVLRQGGHADVELRDLNVEAFDDLLNAEPLEEACQQIRRARASVPGDGPRHDRLTALLAVEREVLQEIGPAREVLRGDGFYRPEELLFAKRIVQLACRLVSGADERVKFGKYSYSTAPYDSFEDVLAAVQEDAGPLNGYFQDRMVPSLLARRPRMIGMSVSYFSQLVPAFILAEHIRRRDPSIHLTMGGPVITWGREVLVNDARFSRWLDSFFIGESEDSLLAMTDALDGRRPVTSVPNVVRYVDGHVHDQYDPDHHVGLDALPTPDFTMLPMERYLAPKRVICLVPTRGCYYNRCTFCNYAFIKLAPYRLRSPELIAQDVERIQAATGEDVFCFESDVILPLHLRRIADALIERGVDIKWHGVARFERGMTPALFDLMKRSGCIRLYMGMESANDRVLGIMDKGTTAERMSAILGMCRAAGIAVEAGIFTGFPGETAEEAEDTYRFTLAHRDALTRADVGGFRMLKGAPVADDPASFDVRIVGDPKRRWYHLDFEPISPDASVPGPSVAARIQGLYPEVALIDVPEDILYNAERGPHVFAEMLGRLEPDAGPGPRDGDDLVVADPIELHEVLITNSGAVYGDAELDGAGLHAPFERSQVRVLTAVRRAQRTVLPLSEDDAAALAALRATRDHAAARARFASSAVSAASTASGDDADARWRSALGRLVRAGLVVVTAPTPGRG